MALSLGLSFLCTGVIKHCFKESGSLLFLMKLLIKLVSSQKFTMLPAFFDLKLFKWNLLENETIEMFAKLRTSPLSFLFTSKTDFATFEINLNNEKFHLYLSAI